MKNKTLKTFIALLFLSLVSIFICQFFTRSQWNVTNRKWKWIKMKIFSTSETVDYAIIGSSYAWCAIYPNLISKKMNGKKTWNLGRNWDGRDVDYLIVKELVKHHQVKNIIIQFYDGEVQEAHPYYRYLVSPADAFHEMVYYLKNTKITDKERVKERINTILSYFADLSVRAYWQILREDEALNPAYIKKSNRLNGFYILDDTAKQQKSKFEKVKNMTWKIRPGNKEFFPSGSRASFYLDKIHRLCLTYDVDLYFVFIPQYCHTLPSKSTFDFFSQRGEVLIPDIKLITNMKFWRNPGHLFQKGSRIFTRQLIKLLKKGKEASPYYHYYK